MNFREFHLEECSSLLQMFLEFCDGGALDSILVDLQKGLTEAQIAYVTHQICVGLGHLHRCAIIHRDLKAGQLLMFLNRSKDMRMLFI